MLPLCRFRKWRRRRRWSGGEVHSWAGGCGWDEGYIKLQIVFCRFHSLRYFKHWLLWHFPGPLLQLYLNSYLYLYLPLLSVPCSIALQADIRLSHLRVHTVAIVSTHHRLFLNISMPHWMPLNWVLVAMLMISNVVSAADLNIPIDLNLINTTFH